MSGYATPAPMPNPDAWRQGNPMEIDIPDIVGRSDEGIIEFFVEFAKFYVPPTTVDMAMFWAGAATWLHDIRRGRNADLDSGILFAFLARWYFPPDPDDGPASPEDEAA